MLYCVLYLLGRSERPFRLHTYIITYVYIMLMAIGYNLNAFRPFLTGVFAMLRKIVTITTSTISLRKNPVRAN